MIPSFSYLYSRYKNSLCALLDHGHIGCDYALQVLQQSAITPRDPDARMEESVF